MVWTRYNCERKWTVALQSAVLTYIMQIPKGIWRDLSDLLWAECAHLFWYDNSHIIWLFQNRLRDTKVSQTIKKTSFRKILKREISNLQISRRKQPEILCRVISIINIPNKSHIKKTLLILRRGFNHEQGMNVWRSTIPCKYM